MAPLQLYSSALITCPTKSVIRKNFKENIPAYITSFPKAESQWSPCFQVLEGHTSYVNSVAFSHDSKLLASGSQGHVIRIWEVDTGKHIRTLEGHHGPVTCVTFSHDSALLASAAHDGTIRLWSTYTGDHIKTFESGLNDFDSVQFLSDSKIIGAGPIAARIHVWSIETGEALDSLEGHTSWVTSLAVSNEGRMIASGSQDGSIRIWSADTGKHLQTLEAHTTCVTSVTFSPSSNHLLSASYDHSFRVWKLYGGQYQQIHHKEEQTAIMSIACSPDFEFVAYAMGKIIRLRSLQLNHEGLILSGHSKTSTSVVFSRDSRFIASGAEDNSVRIWSTNLVEWAKHGCKNDPSKDWNPSNRSNVRIAPDSKTIATTSGSRIDLLSFDTKKPYHKLEGHEDMILSLTFSPNSKLLATCSLDRTVRIWSCGTGTCLYTLQLNGRPSVAAFAADSTHLAVGVRQRIQVWGLESRTCRDIDIGRFHSISALAFSHDMNLLASASNHIVFGAVQIWQLSPLKRGVEPENGIDNTLVAFSHDSNFITSFSPFPEYLIRVWDVRTGTLLQEIKLSCKIFDLSFDRKMKALRTSHGPVSLYRTLQASDQNNVPPSVPKENTVHFGDAYSLSEDCSWIQYGGENILWLPYEYRPEITDRFSSPFSHEVRGSTVVLGWNSGDIGIFEFNTALYKSSLE